MPEMSDTGSSDDMNSAEENALLNIKSPGAANKRTSILQKAGTKIFKKNRD